MFTRLIECVRLARSPSIYWILRGLATIQRRGGVRLVGDLVRFSICRKRIEERMRMRSRILGLDGRKANESGVPNVGVDD